ncbi:tyrosine-type recombinase/integrase [Cohnella sp.]|uniref:tyrosine-type recombinase/integrase n=1 Tax=Cohnella sp. TaxID=1883426 RepID=UPI0035692C29
MEKKGKEKKAKKPRKKKLPTGVRERDGRFTFRYTVPITVNGKKRRKFKETISYPTAQAAFDAGVLIKADIINNRYVDPDNVLFEQWAEKFLEIYERSGKKKSNTLKVRRGSLRRPLKRWTGRKLKEIAAYEYQELLDEMRSEGLSKSTITQTWSTMGMMFEKAANKPYSLIAHDITEEVTFPDFSTTVEELEDQDPAELYFEKDKLALLLRAAEEMASAASNEEEAFRSKQLFRAFFILAYSGLRIGELCALEDKDILEATKQLRVIKNLDASGGIQKFVIDTPKTKSSIRTVDVTDRVIAALKTQIHERKKFRLLVGKRYAKSDRNFIFINARAFPGLPMSPRDAEEHMKIVLNRTGFPLHLTPHNLRHTYVSLSAEAGIDLNSIQRQIGHTKDAATTRIYNHVTEARRRADVEKLDALIDSIGK